jgi:serine/threonine protein kinase
MLLREWVLEKRATKSSLKKSKYVVRVIDAWLDNSQNPPIIHSDLIPANTLFDIEINESHVRVADFGAMAILRYDDELHTIDKETPKYTAPEVVKGQKNDMKADVYSLGIVLKELFSLDISIGRFHPKLNFTLN